MMSAKQVRYLEALQLFRAPVEVESNGWVRIRGHWISPKIVESLIVQGLLERQGKNVRPTEKGKEAAR